MSATEFLCQIIGVNPAVFSMTENILLEAELFTRVCEQLKEVYREKYKNYFRVMKFTTEMENSMLDSNFIRYALNDILLTEDYSVAGIAYHTRIPEEVISDLVAGFNTTPSLPLSRQIINLHRSVKPALYKEMMEKILLAYVNSD